mmetsp:Transcript_22421/g.57592  ORF Transcript_22421/g.57592 Transcript_22421/m.57592 type:complete len:235 (+) Transcript_22421:347-1051(+)
MWWWGSCVLRELYIHSGDHRKVVAWPHPARLQQAHVRVVRCGRRQGGVGLVPACHDHVGHVHVHRQHQLIFVPHSHRPNFARLSLELGSHLERGEVGGWGDHLQPRFRHRRAEVGNVRIYNGRHAFALRGRKTAELGRPDACLLHLSRGLIRPRRIKVHIPAHDCPHHTLELARLLDQARNEGPLLRGLLVEALAVQRRHRQLRCRRADRPLHPCLLPSATLSSPSIEQINRYN